MQTKMIELGHSRRYINDCIDRIRRMFRWGVAKELIPPATSQALGAVRSLAKHRSEAREPGPVRPVDDDTIEATLPFLPPIVADMVRFQRLTSCRPGDVCLVRPGDVDLSGEVWLYRPSTHKTEHHDHDRVICIGPQAQDVLRPYLLRDQGAYCFSPVESERRRNLAKRASRKSPMTPPQAQRQLKKAPRCSAGERYTTASYRRAIQRAVDRINRQQKKQGQPQLERWSPNRLRHTAATEIRRQFGLEAAQVALGHSSADVSQIYAERDLTLAQEIARRVG